MFGVCRGIRPGSCPSQLPKALIRYPKMVTDLVDDRYCDAVAELLLGSGDPQMRHPEYRDPVRHHSAVRDRAAACQSYALIEPEQHSAVPTLLGGCRSVLDHDGDVFDVSGQFIRDRVESFCHEFLKSIPANIDGHGREDIGGGASRNRIKE